MNSILKIYARSMYDFQQVKNEFSGRVRASEEEQKFPDDRKDELASYMKNLKMAEDKLVKMIEPYLQEYPIYEDFFCKIRGCAIKMSACVISAVEDITKFPTVSKLWAYAGLHVIGGKAARRKKGEKANWNSFLKTKLHVLADCLIKQNFDPETNEPLRYRKMYDDYKHRLENRDHCHLTKEEHSKAKDSAVTWLPNGCTKGHVHNMSMRYIQKMFLQDMWTRWWELAAGQPPTQPYAQAVLGRKEHHVYC